MASYHTAEVIDISDNHSQIHCYSCYQLRPHYNYIWTWLFTNELIGNKTICEECVASENINVIRDGNTVYSCIVHPDATIRIITWSTRRLYNLFYTSSDSTLVKL